MSTKISLLILSVLSLCLVPNIQAGSNLEETSRQAVSSNPAEAEKAIKILREAGPSGLDSLLTTYATEIKQFTAGQKVENWSPIARALDAVSKQKDSYASKLFWYTDLAKAKTEAQKTGKPILTLRLLGNLDEELTCANSRFFRAVLYPNAEISKTLREKFILHWQSVRPVPKVTIDFGDGRKIERTLTGNSIHYVIDLQGNLLEALPGLYSPQAFLSWLNESERVFQKSREIEDFIRDGFLREYYKLRVEKIRQDWQKDLAKVDGKTAQSLTKSKTELLEGQDLVAVSAMKARRNAMSKMIVETKTLRSITADNSILEEDTSIDDWRKIAAFYTEKSRIDTNSRAFIQRQTKTKDEAQLARLISNFESYLALDTVRNEYLYHGKLYEWMLTPQSLDAFNDKVYADLFLTPKSDPWLGLYSPETYSAIENNGIF
jgi:hypothetical protein